MKHILKVSTIVLLGILPLAFGTSPPLTLAQAGSWSEPINISHTPDGSWFPDLVVDSQGNVHVVWCETVVPETGSYRESVYYTGQDGEEWRKPNDIVPVSPDIIRNALAIDKLGNLYMTFRYGAVSGLNMFFTQAPVSQAWSGAAWSTPHRIDVKGNAYMSDLAIDSRGVIHLVLDDGGDLESKTCPGCADLYYRRSEDKGLTWSQPVNLSRSPVGNSREQIKIDSSDTIHVTWDEGWDRLSGIGEATSSNYTFSTDGGRSWSPVMSVTYPDFTVAQLTVGSDGQGGVMLVWRARSRGEVFFQWSTDGGYSWSAPSTIPRIFARPWITRFDMYAMDTDSAGHIHLLMVGRESQQEDSLLGVYHLIWDGVSWSTPERIFVGAELFPAYPKIIVHEGNQLHAVWFAREQNMWDDDVNREVWYSSSQSPAPHQAVTPLPHPTSKPPTATPRPLPTATPYPTIDAEGTGLPNGLYTESDEVIRLALALSPVALMVLIIIAVKMGWLGKLRL
jgi:hypothetical protein